LGEKTLEASAENIDQFLPAQLRSRGVCWLAFCWSNHGLEIVRDVVMLTIVSSSVPTMQISEMLKP